MHETPFNPPSSFTTVNWRIYINFILQKSFYSGYVYIVTMIPQTFAVVIVAETGRFCGWNLNGSDDVNQLLAYVSDTEGVKHGKLFMLEETSKKLSTDT